MYVTGALHTAGISTVKVIMSSDKQIEKVNFKLLGYGFDSCQGLSIFLCPVLVSC